MVVHILLLMGIGVSDFIQLDDVRSEIDSIYSNPGVDVSSPLKVGHQSHSHKLVGKSFDLLCRFWLSHRVESVIEPHQSRSRKGYTGNLLPDRETVVYEDGEEPEAEILESERVVNVRSHRGRTVVSMVPKPIHLAEKQVEQFVETGMNADNAVNAALLFSGWDQHNPDEPSNIDLDSFSEELVSELQDLFHHFREQDWTDGDCVYLGPNFGRHSCILEGEADFIVDDTLIDVKTTEDGTFKREYWRQLLSYYILNDIQRVLYEETDRADEEYPELTKVGVYFARYGKLKVIHVNDVIDDVDAYERFRAWFVDRAVEENHDDRINYADYRAALTDPYDFERQQTLFDF